MKNNSKQTSGGGGTQSQALRNNADSIWNSEIGRRSFLKKTGMASVATMAGIQGLKVDVLAQGGSGAMGPWKYTEVEEQVGIVEQAFDHAPSEAEMNAVRGAAEQIGGTHDPTLDKIISEIISATELKEIGIPIAYISSETSVSTVRVGFNQVPVAWIVKVKVISEIHHKYGPK